MKTSITIITAGVLAAGTACASPVSPGAALADQAEVAKPSVDDAKLMLAEDDQRRRDRGNSNSSNNSSNSSSNSSDEDPDRRR